MQGGLVVAPSGPNLADLDQMPDYQGAVTNADLAIVDSGFLALCWRWRAGETLSRISGLLLLQTLLQSEAFRQTHNQLWVMPNRESIAATRHYLASQGVTLGEDSFYHAPMYPLGEIEDAALLERVRDQRPELVLIHVAGGKQEVLGAWLKRQLDYRPAIICTGAAIAFLTGEQANIPAWGDRLFLGWLLRILWRPSQYLPRYWQARRLWRLVKTYGEEAPRQIGHV